MKSAIISAEQQKFIYDNHKKMTVPELAEGAGLKKGNIHMFLQKKKIKALPTRKRSFDKPSFERDGFFDVNAYKHEII